jgi:hypothetical protein
VYRLDRDRNIHRDIDAVVTSLLLTRGPHASSVPGITVGPRAGARSQLEERREDHACRVPAGTCSEAYHNDGLGGCLQEGCALGFHDGGGLCVADGICQTGWHDNGEGICVHSGCSFGFHDNGAGTCVQTGCFAGSHNGGDGTCVAPGTCVEGYHNDGTGACVQVGCALGFHDGGGTCVANICVPGTPGCLKPNGPSCAAASECNSGFCVDGCNQA